MTIRLYLYSILLILVFLPMQGLAAPSPAPKETKRVLVLYSLDKGHPAHGLTEQGIGEVFRTNGDYDVQLYSEYLDMGRFSGPVQARGMADFLRRKYAGLKIDVIITVYPTAADFLRGEGRDLFPGVPIVAGEISRSYAEALDRTPERRRISGVILGDNITGILEAAIRMKPGTKHVALVAGSSPLDAYGEQIFRAGLKPYAGRLDLIDLTKLSMKDTLARAGSLPPDTIVFYSSIVRDGAGQSFVPRESLSLVSRAANAPVFGLFDSFVGYGIVGGRLVSFYLQGKTAAGMALRVVAGESPPAIPFGGDEAYVDLYDWRELKRWQVPATAIPAGSEIRYRQTTFWEEHRWIVIGAVSLAIVETALIFVLVINIKHRKRAKQELIESQLRLNLAVESAEAGLWTLDMETGRIWATDRALAMYGFMPGETVTRDRFLAIVHGDDRERVVLAMADAVQNRKSYNLEYRVNLPDGAVRWIAVRGRYSPTPEMPVGLAGASIDISERKLAEQTLQMERSFSEALLESLPGLFYLYTFPEMRLVRWNRNHETATGYGPEELYNRYALDWFAPADQEAVAEGIKKVIELGRFVTESNLIMKDGRSVPYLLTGARFQYLDQPYCMGLGMDITERKQMEVSLRDSEQNLRSLSGKLLSAQEEERSRIARELHDDVTQRLAVLAIEMGKLELQPVSAPHQWKAEVAAVKNSLVRISEDIHAISRKLHPSILDDLGLVRAIQSESAAFTRREGIDVAFRHEAVPEQLPKDISLALYRIIQESLRNIARHSQAKSAHILVNCADNMLNLSIADAGVGFDPLQVQNRAGLGLVSMAERIKLVRGTISVDSVPGEGTVINVQVPLGVNTP